jgi:hypothetical protein
MMFHELSVDGVTVRDYSNPDSIWYVWQVHRDVSCWVREMEISGFRSSERRRWLIRSHRKYLFYCARGFFSAT